MTLTITIGCPGAGKSSWADEHFSTHTLRLERDRFRECIYGSRRAYHAHDSTPQQRSSLITQAMLTAMMYWPTPHWAVTDTGLDFTSVAPFIWHAERCEVPIELYVFDVPLHTLLERNNTREEAHRVPEYILRECHQKYHGPDAWWRSDPYHALIEYV